MTKSLPESIPCECCHFSHARCLCRCHSIGRPANRRGTLRSRRHGLGAWERLGLGLGDLEQLEQRSLMAADLVLSFNDNIAANVDRTFYSPASQVVYTLTVENKGERHRRPKRC
jgi:hypothetical protein